MKLGCFASLVVAGLMVACSSSNPAGMPVGARADSFVGAATVVVPPQLAAAGIAVVITHVNTVPTNTITGPGTCHVRLSADGNSLPDRGCTPGAVWAAVTQSNIKTTICKTGWTSTVRPQSTTAAKTKTLAAYSLDPKQSRVTEYDHLISLELGGAPSDTRNLWTEPNIAGARSFANPKDGVENALNRAVCLGKVRLIEAQIAVALDWSTARTKLGV